MRDSGENVKGDGDSDDDDDDDDTRVSWLFQRIIYLIPFNSCCLTYGTVVM